LFGDFLYSASVTEFFNFQFIFVSLFTLLFIGAYFLKKRLIFYNV